METSSILSIIKDFEAMYLNNKRKCRKAKKYLEILARVYPNAITCKELVLLSGKSISTIYNNNLKDLVELG